MVRALDAQREESREKNPRRAAWERSAGDGEKEQEHWTCRDGRDPADKKEDVTI